MPTGLTPQVRFPAEVARLATEFVLRREFRVPILLDTEVTTQEVVNTIVQTSIYSRSIEANRLGTANWVQVEILGDYLNNSGGNATFTMRLKYGATTVANVVPTYSTGAARFAMLIKATLYAKSATNSQEGVIALERMHADTTADHIGNAQRGTAAEDSTLAKTLDVTVQHSAAAATISFKKFSVKVTYFEAV